MSTVAAGRSWPEEGVTRVPYWVYTDPEIYRLEQERIFGGPHWSYIGLSCEIPLPGDFLTTRIGDVPVVVVRDEAGAVGCVRNECAHRGVQFCRVPRGNAREFQCPYHQWLYDLRGNLVGVPFRRGVARKGGMPRDFRLEDHGLARLRVAERHGVLFASFDEKTPDLPGYLGESMLRYFDRVFDGRALRLLGHTRQRIRGNWKLMFENIKDPYHASLLHVFLVSFGLFRADQPSHTLMDPTGRHSCLVSRRGEQKASADTQDMRSMDERLELRDPRLLDPVPEFPGDATVVMQTLWPNLIVQQQSNTLATRQIVPRGPGAFDLNWTFFGYADDDEAMARRRLRQANLMGPSGLVSLDDSEVMLLCQQGLATDPDGHGLYEMGGHDTSDQDHIVTEAAIRAFYAHYRRVLEL